MFDFNKARVLEFMDKVTDVISSAAPLATMFGIPFVEKIAGWADTAIDVGKNVMERAEEGKIVLESQDVDDINERIVKLSAVNDQLAEIIRNS